MNEDHQKQFIAKVRRALGKPLDDNPATNLFDLAPDDLAGRLARYDDRSPGDRASLREELGRRAAAVDMQVSFVADAAAAGRKIAELVRQKSPEWGSAKRIVAWDHPLMEALDLSGCLKGDHVPVTYTRLADDQPAERHRLRREVEAAFIGITSADFVVAHTATLVMKTRPHQLRSVSLVPAIHVCVVTADQLVADLEELYTHLQWDPRHRAEGLTNCLTFISAPSKTGDIELVMVNGAHGPREVHLVVIDK